jgi:hypothetical protein
VCSVCVLVFVLGGGGGAVSPVRTVARSAIESKNSDNSDSEAEEVVGSKRKARGRGSNQPLISPTGTVLEVQHVFFFFF